MKRITLTIAVAFIAITLAFGQKVGTGIGDKAPEISLPDDHGNIVNLSDLKGKYVLIDFWASWCGPCRKENPNIVKAYTEYSDAKFKDGEGFEVMGVSIDMKTELWKKAIIADELTYKYHLIDSTGWSSPYIKAYNITGVPTSYLIDGNGIIIDKNLRGDALHFRLKKLKRRK